MAFDNWDATQEWLTYLSKHHRHNYAELGGALLNLVPELRSQLHELDEPNYHIGTSHANYGQSVKRTTIDLVENDTITLKMVNDDEIYYKHNLRRSSRKYEVEVNGTTKVYSNYVKVDVKRSNSNEAYVVLQKESRGKSRTSANKNAEKIEYKFEIVNNTIVLDAYYLSDYRNLWKDEEINATFYLPEGITVYFDNSVKNFLYNVDNEADIYDKDMANHHFKMTDDKLKCTDCVEEIEDNEIIEEESI